MTTEQKQLIKTALRKYHAIRPCGRKAMFQDCFTQDDVGLFFWFNTLDGSTHLESVRYDSILRYSRGVHSNPESMIRYGG